MRTSIAVGAVLSAVALLGAAPAAQARPEATGEPIPIQKFYDNGFAGQPDYILMGGPGSIADWCLGNPGTAYLSVTETPSRMFLEASGWLDIQLFDADGLGAPDFVGRACETGEYPEPLGTGTGWLDDRIIVDIASDTARNPNSLTGFVTLQDGSRVRVRGTAFNQFDGPEGGYPVRVNLTVGGM
jgi:hypothetical protein